VPEHTFSRLCCRRMIIRKAGTAVGICEMTCQTLCAPENTLTSLARQLLNSCTRVLLLRLLFACAFAQRVSLRRSLGGGHFDALGCGHFDTLGKAIVTCAFRHRASGTMKFAKLSNEGEEDSSDADEIEDMTDPAYAARKREELQKERAQNLCMVSAQEDVLLGAEHAAAAAAKGAALGAAKSATFGH
jgi:hypothetical protein